MTHRMNQQGKSLRSLLLLFLAVGCLAILMSGMHTVPGRAAENENLLGQLAQTQSEEVQANQIQKQQFNSRPIISQVMQNGQVQFRPVTESEYREESVVIKVPKFDPKTGKTVMRETQQIVRYPVTQQHWERRYTTHIASAHSQKAMKLAAELRYMKDDDNSRKEKLAELRSELESEFTRLHKQQLKEIERTEERLRALRKVHANRQNNKDKIVDRRIDELIGKADPLGWNPATLYHTQQAIQPAPANPHSTRRSMPLPQSLPRPQTPGAPNAPSTSDKYETRTFFSYPSPVGQPGLLRLPFSHQLTEPANPGPNDNPLAERISRRKSSPTTLDNSPDTRVQARAVASQQRDATRDPDDDPAASSAARTKISAPGSALGEVFNLARSAAASSAVLAIAEIEYQQHKELHEKDAIADLEFSKAELRFEEAKREVKLIQMQTKALLESMERTKELAKSNLERASLKLDVIKKGHQNGVHTDREISEATVEAREAEIALTEASEVLEKLKETITTIQSFSKPQADDDSAENLPGSIATPDAIDITAKDTGDIDSHAKQGDPEQRL